MGLQKRYRYKFEGVVQGVGFRPFVYKLALKYGLKGFVNNSSEGVFLEAEADKEAICEFENEFYSSLPPLAKIDKTIKTEITPLSESEFKIIQSKTSKAKFASISPDIAICDDCLRELNDKHNRRYNYFLTNCTNCGPRYSIIKKVPYDRINTSMDRFKMCAECQEEYTNPLDRRYHAQPISCHRCGPRAKFYKTFSKELLKCDEEAIKLCAKSIKRGNIVAIKGMGGFHIVCSATSPKSVKLLRKRKRRPSKPFAVMFKNIEDIKKVAIVSKKEEELILSKEKPIVIVNKKEPHKLRKRELPITSFVAPGIDRIGVFLPYTPLHHLIFDYIDCPIVATSANLSEEPIIRDRVELCEKLGNVVDFVLDFDREIVNACDDSVVQAVGDKKETLRLARGYAPKYQKLSCKLDKKILCVGANQKNTITLAYEDIVVTSPHIGDLNSITAMEYFERSVETFKRFYDFEPEMVVCDKHPGYETTKWAKKLKTKNEKIKIYEVQHHYAHILSCMAEFSLKEKVLGFSWDGTGYGDDGSIWGGEVFVCDEKSYERVFSFEPFKLIGGDKAVKEPKRVALSYLFQNFSLKEILQMNLPTVKNFSEKEIKNFYKIWKNTKLETSSVGRIFDIFASFCDVVQINGYEGESGLRLEAYFDDSINESFNYEIKNGRIDLSLSLNKVVSLMKENININDKRVKISSMLINTLTNIIKDISSRYNLPVILSGGVFQNKTLLNKTVKELEKSDKKVYFQQDTAINDGGISLGQAWWAVHNIA